MKRYPLLTLATGLLLTGCLSVGPNYKPPPVSRPDYSDVLRSQPGRETGRRAAITSDTLAAWWTGFNDPILTELIGEAVQGNLDMQGARARLREARAQLTIARAPLFPSLDANGSFTRSRNSQNTTAGQAALTQGNGLEHNSYNAAFDASWEIDLFGGTRRAAEAAADDAQAQQAALDSVWVSLAGEIGRTYIETRTDQQRLRVARDNLRAQSETLAILESRFKAGLSDELAVQQARYNLERTRSAIPPLRSGLESDMNALAVLTGKMPGELHHLLSAPAPIPAPPLNVVTDIPADTLRQRPDIRLLERQLAAQNARIGEAKAQYYPTFQLLGSFGLESKDSSHFLSNASRTWSFGPAIYWPILHVGAIHAYVQGQKAREAQALAQYKKAVLGAVKEVRDALSAFSQEEDRRASLQAAVKAAQSAVEVAQDKYKQGLVDFNNVLDAQRSLFSFQDELITSQGAISSDLIQLYKALGGGWAVPRKSAQPENPGPTENPA